MTLNRRDFLQVLSVAAASGMMLRPEYVSAQAAANQFYDLPPFGNVHLLHFTDCHAQLKPIYFREPNVNLGFAGQFGRAPHLVGEHLLKAFKIKPGSRDAYAFTHLNFQAAARNYGRVGGFAHLSTLVKKMKSSRPGALLLDGGDT